MTRRVRMSRDAWLLIAGQGVRAAGYGFTAVVLGAVLAARGYGPWQAAVVFAAIIAGTAATSLLVGRVADRIGRRWCYAAFYLLLTVAGGLAAAESSFWVLVAVALTGTLSTDVVDNGPATTLEQVMLAGEDGGTSRVYARYNAVGAAAGAAGALAVAMPALSGPGAEVVAAGVLFAALVPVGLVGVLLTVWLSPAVEAGGEPDHVETSHSGAAGGGLHGSREVVHRLAGLFAIDAAAGGLVTTGFLSYLFASRYGADFGQLGWLFFAVAVVQALSVLLAPRLAARFGLVTTMVGTHLPSNLLLAAVAFAPSFSSAAALLLARTALSQMDVPTRQALVMTVVTPSERAAAAGLTNAARYTVRPVGPIAAGALQQLALAAPLLAAGTLKAGYDLALWWWAQRRLPAALHAPTDASDRSAEPLRGSMPATLRGTPAPDPTDHTEGPVHPSQGAAP